MEQLQEEVAGTEPDGGQQESQQDIVDQPYRQDLAAFFVLLSAPAGSQEDALMLLAM